MWNKKEEEKGLENHVVHPINQPACVEALAVVLCSLLAGFALWSSPDTVLIIDEILVA
jgi:hypothetical protein